jgi:DUF4097 and DUF4098 domain-containing protein YvlB
MSRRFFSLFLVIFATTGLAASQAPVRSDAIVAVKYTRGDIRIIGTDSDTIEATIVQRLTGERTPLNPERRSDQVLITDQGRADEASAELEVTLPRTARIAPLVNLANAIIVSGMRTPLDLQTESGSVKVDQLAGGRITTRSGNVVITVLAGAAVIRTASGNITVSGGETSAPGKPLDIVTGNGNIRLADIPIDIHIVATNSKIGLDCIAGNIDIRDTSSQIEITRAGGNIDLNSPNGAVNITAPSGFSGIYRLKTLSGRLNVMVPENVGFAYKMSSYQGRMENAFAADGNASARSGQYLTGKAVVEMDAFDGRLALRKRMRTDEKPCDRR